MRVIAGLVAILAVGCSRPTALERLGADEATAREAIAEFVTLGEVALPELREAATHEDALVRRRAKTAIGRITGQWGSGAGLKWKRSVAEAAGQGKPILVLHLFGKFDEEFC